MPSSPFVFGNFNVAFFARIFCRSLPRVRSLLRLPRDRRVRYPLRCSCSWRFRRFWWRRIFVRVRCV